jgi:hypothetical protein
LSGLTFLAKSFNDGDWEGFCRADDRVVPKYNRTMLLPFSDDDIRGDYPITSALAGDFPTSTLQN